ncbi:MAG: TIGR02186 family protein [Kordiimonadaceae bacterium]|nr:TIGR02186 family protein [Kordiimonadaceae bacterium]
MRIIAGILVCAFLALVSLPVVGLVTDLSNRRIEIRYSFDGAELILFGAVGSSAVDPVNDKFDIVVVVRGPEVETVVRRKEKVGIIWINNDELVFPSAPGYYAVAASRKLADIAHPTVFASYGIGFDNLPLIARTDKGLVEPNADFRAALYRLRAQDDLYRQERDSVTLVAEGLFRTDVFLPANVPVGQFQVETFVFQEGSLKARNRILLTVDKEGFERAAYDFAHEHPFLYGLLAVVVALGAGWFAGVVGKK